MLRLIGRVIAWGVACWASAGIAEANPGSSDPDRWLLVEVFDLRPELQVDGSEPRVQVKAGVTSEAIYVALHDGSFDLYEPGELASSALRDFANEGVVDRIVAQLAEQDAAGRIERLTPYGRSEGSFLSSNAYIGSISQSNPFVISSAHRFLSYFAKISPSDDAFVANDNPQRYEIFDEDGNFLGPFVIDVYGDDVLDAGTRENREEDLRWLDRHEPDLGVGSPTVEPIGKHPGFNGSSRNPDGAPKRVLGGEFTWIHEREPPNPPRVIMDLHYDEELADFTRPGAKLFRIKISSGIHAGYDGVWYDPRRSGEGAVMQVYHVDGKPHLMFTWYTYRPDGTGAQAYLVGSGPLDLTGAWIELSETQGGAFASLANPDSVERMPWGRIRIKFEAACKWAYFDEIEPLDPAWKSALPEAAYQLIRVSPLSRSAERQCGLEAHPIPIF